MNLISWKSEFRSHEIRPPDPHSLCVPSLVFLIFLQFLFFWNVLFHYFSPTFLFIFWGATFVICLSIKYLANILNLLGFILLYFTICFRIFISQNLFKMISHLILLKCVKYSRRSLIGSLWAMEKVILITEWSHYPNSLIQWMRAGLGNGTCLNCLNWSHYPVDPIIHDPNKRCPLYLANILNCLFHPFIYYFNFLSLKFLKMILLQCVK